MRKVREIRRSHTGSMPRAQVNLLSNMIEVERIYHEGTDISLALIRDKESEEGEGVGARGREECRSLHLG